MNQVLSQTELFDLTKFNEYPENNRLEVKKAANGLPNSLWETYSAFANCDGGMIILGVGEHTDGSLYTTHLQNTDKLLRDFWNTINNHYKISINLLKDDNVKTYNIDNDIIITIYIPKADRENRPVYINNDIFGGTFRRNHEGDYHCSESEVRGMIRDQANKNTDDKIISDMNISAFFNDTIKAFRTRHQAVNPNHVWHALNNEEYLERIGAAKFSSIDSQLHPTIAGLLMFGDEYKIRYEFPEYFLDYTEILDSSIRWTDRLESSSGEWSGNLVDFFFQMEHKLLHDLKKPFILNGITRVDETPVHKAIREALANCIINADFHFSRGIVIRKNQDSIILENPGNIIIGKAQMIKGGISEPRNKTIMKMFNLIKVGERAGSGVPSIFSIWNEEGWETPTVEELYKPDRTILTLAFIPKQAKKTSGKNKRKKQAEKIRNSSQSAKTIENKKKIEKFIAKQESVKTAEIAEYINLSEARTRVLLAEMINENIIQPDGIGKSRHYVLKTKDESGKSQ